MCGTDPSNESCSVAEVGGGSRGLGHLRAPKATRLAWPARQTSAPPAAVSTISARGYGSFAILGDGTTPLSFTFPTPLQYRAPANRKGLSDRSRERRHIDHLDERRRLLRRLTNGQTPREQARPEGAPARSQSAVSSARSTPPSGHRRVRCRSALGATDSHTCPLAKLSSDRPARKRRGVVIDVIGARILAEVSAGRAGIGRRHIALPDVTRVCRPYE